MTGTKQNYTITLEDISMHVRVMFGTSFFSSTIGDYVSFLLAKEAHPIFMKSGLNPQVCITMYHCCFFVIIVMFDLFVLSLFILIKSFYKLFGCYPITTKIIN
jgi:hypothetical protein